MRAASVQPAAWALWPRPRQVRPAPLLQFRLPVQIEAPAELAGPAALLRRQVGALFGLDATGPRPGLVVRLSLDSRNLARPEEYTVEQGPRVGSAVSIDLRSHDIQGGFWAAHTLDALLQQARRTRNGWGAAIPNIDDWPDSPGRAFLIQGAWTRNLDDLRRNLDLLARMHITYFALEFGPQVVLDFDPSIAQGARFTKAQAKSVIDYGRSLGLKPIAYLNLLGHLDRGYQKAPYTQHGGIDIRSDEAYDKFVYPILSEMLDVYGPVHYFHCGMDEARDLFSWLSGQGADVTGLLARHIQRIDEFLKARGVRLVIWQDMLVAPDLQKQLGAPIGPANGGPPQDTAAALGKIPKDVILDYWFYDAEPAYPVLEYLRQQGFTVWASPWQAPFSLVRYAQARQAPTMGTLWDSPPGCFASSTYSPVTALYAQAAWNAEAAPADVQPEPAMRADAQTATNVALWGRQTLQFPGTAALLLSTSGPQREPVAGAPEQFYGVPLDTRRPIAIDPLPDVTQPLTQPSQAAAIRLPGGNILQLDGVNTYRGADQLILYAAPLQRTGANTYGCEVAVGADGAVLEVDGYGSGDHAIPPGGFVLSAHMGKAHAKADALMTLHPGSQLAVLGTHGERIAEFAPAHFLVDLPGRPPLPLDGQDANRQAGQIILYTPDYNSGHTGANQFGVEVTVQAGKVTAVRAGAGDSAIPADGYVLSAQRGATGDSADALQALHAGDVVRLLVEKGGKQYDLDALLAERSRVLPVGAKCSALYLAVSAGRAVRPDTSLGEWQVRYADGSVERIPCRFGREAAPADLATLPERLDDPVWMIQQEKGSFLVREWPNPHPERIVREIVFVPAAAVLETGAHIMAATAALAGGA